MNKYEELNLTDADSPLELTLNDIAATKKVLKVIKTATKLHNSELSLTTIFEELSDLEEELTNQIKTQKDFQNREHFRVLMNAPTTIENLDKINFVLHILFLI